jgi:coniferyl-aldehyde dehydrogenase
MLDFDLRVGFHHSGTPPCERLPLTARLAVPDITSVEPSRPAQDPTRLFEAQRRAYRSTGSPDYALRRDRLQRLLRVIEDNEEALVDAMRLDFGHRSPVESRMLDIALTMGDIRQDIRRLKGWMSPRRVATPLHMRPARSRIIPQPLGVVGVIGPWNFPVYTAIPPVAAAIAAGNRVMLKPSELTPRTSALLADAISKVFAEDELAVIIGGIDVARAFSSLPFDHLFFTGSTAVGREVAKAAALNLTPVTLELGGKSPCVVTPSADVALVATKIVYGKLINAGQACIAPDYVLLPRGSEQAFAQAAQAAAAKHYPTLADNPDFTAVFSAGHYARLEALVRDAEEQGAQVTRVNPANEALDPEKRKMPLTLIAGATGAMRVMQSEVFGPLLPVVSYDELSDAIAFVNERDRPLALYAFGKAADCDRVLRETVSGGATVNDVLWHVANEKLPFGGVGPSGMGAYHGQAGFDTFSHHKSVLYQPAFNAIPLFYPPYGKTMAFIVNVLKKFI